MKRLPLAIFFLFVAPLALGASMYKVITPEGKVIYTDKPPTVGKSKVEDMGQYTPEPPRPPVVQSQSNRDTSNAMPRPRTETRELSLSGVVMFSAPGCSYCMKAKEFFAHRKTSYTEYDISQDRAAYDIYKELGGQGVPLIVVNGQIMKGFNAQGLETLLKQRSL